MEKSRKNSSGTSFHGNVVETTINKLIDICGHPKEVGSGDDKVTHSWTMETDEGDVFTIYDWKEYRELDNDEIIEWHIGGHSGRVTEKAEMELLIEIMK